MDITEALNELRTLRDLIRFGASRFAEEPLWYGHGTDNPLDEAAAIVHAALNLPHNIDRDYLNAALTSTERSTILEMFARRVDERMPVPYLVNEAWFCGMPFYVDERVLIPRSPIAELIENRFQPWLSDQAVHRIADVGTGSGCIAIACAHYFPEAMVDALDISKDALDVAAGNISQHELDGQVNPIESDLLGAVAGEVYDLIVSNPPYVGQEEMNDLPDEYSHEPKDALASGEAGLDHVLPLLKAALRQLSPEGLLVVEVGNSWQALEAAQPSLPFTWVDFERGGDGVFVMDAATLRENEAAILGA